MLGWTCDVDGHVPFAKCILNLLIHGFYSRVARYSAASKN